MSERFTVDYFISKFEAIPEDRWCSGYFFDGVDKYCALGFCGARIRQNIDGSKAIYPTDESKALYRLFYSTLGLLISNINDLPTSLYQQPTPKQRTIAALYDIKAKQAKQEKPVLQ